MDLMEILVRNKFNCFCYANNLLEAFVRMSLVFKFAGMMILIFSYANHFRFSVMTENATMNKDELKRFIKRMEQEINILHEITLLPENHFENLKSKNENLQIRMIN